MEPYRALMMHCFAASFLIKSQHLFPSRCRSRGCSALPQSRGNLIWIMSKDPRRNRSGNSEVPTPGETAVADTLAREARHQYLKTRLVHVKTLFVATQDTTAAVAEGEA